MKIFELGMMHAVIIERPVGLSSFFDQAECRLKSEESVATPVGNTAHMKNDQLKHRPSQWALFLALVVVATLRCADMGMMKSTTSVRTYSEMCLFLFLAIFSLSRTEHVGTFSSMTNETVGEMRLSLDYYFSP